MVCHPFPNPSPIKGEGLSDHIIAALPSPLPLREKGQW
jgi:hypothetical protein